MKYILFPYFEEEEELPRNKNDLLLVLLWKIDRLFSLTLFIRAEEWIVCNTFEINRH